MKIRLLHSDLLDVLNKINNSEITIDNICIELGIRNIIKKNKIKKVKICRSVLYISDSSDDDDNIDNDNNY